MGWQLLCGIWATLGGDNLHIARNYDTLCLFPLCLVASVKPKVHSRQSRINSYVEVMVDGLPSETKKTGKRIGSSELLWNEILLM